MTKETDKAADVAPQGAHVAPEKASSKKGATRRKDAPKGQKAAKGGKPKPVPPKKEAKATKTAKRAKAGKGTKEARPGSKKAQILALIRRSQGATLDQIMKATDWQAHTVRGFISGTLSKKMGLKIDSTKRDDGERVYSIAG